MAIFNSYVKLPEGIYCPVRTELGTKLEQKPPSDSANLTRSFSAMALPSTVSDVAKHAVFGLNLKIWA